MNHRYTGELTFKMRKNYGPFQVDQSEPKPEKLGVGPYCVYYKDQVVHQEQFQGDCKDWVVDLVDDHRQLTRKIQELKSEFIKKWQLTDFPDNLSR